MNIPLRQYWCLLARYIKPQKGRFMSLAILLLSSIGFQLVNPQIMRHFIDATQSVATSWSLLRLALLFIGVALAQQVVSVMATYVSENVAWTATNALRADLAEHCLRLDMSFHNAHTPGEMIERVDGDVTALSNFFSQFVIQVLGNALLLVGVLALLYREDWRIGLALTGFALLTLFVLGRFQNIAVPHWGAERQASADLFGFLEERLAGTEDIRSNGTEAYVMRGFYRLMRELMRRSLKATLMVNILFNSTFLLFALGNAVAFAVGAWLFREGMLTVGTAYIVFYYTNMLERPIEHITRQLGDLQKAAAGIARIRALFDVRSKIQEAGDGAVGALPRGALAVEFQTRLVALAMDDSGLPDSCEARWKALDAVFAATDAAGIPRDRIYVDPLVRPVATHPEQAGRCLQMIREIGERGGGARTVVGLSNISFGLPGRRHLNRTFLALAAASGLSAAIIDPLEPDLMATALAAACLTGRDDFCMDYITAQRKGRL